MAARTITQPLIDLLNADTTLQSLAPAGAWLSVAPSVAETGSRPVIVVRLSAAPLVVESMDDADGRTFRFVVFAESLQEEVETLRDIVDRMFVMLHRVQWDAGAEWHVVRSVFTDVVEEAETDGQYRFHRLGGVLEVWADQV